LTVVIPAAARAVNPKDIYIIYLYQVYVFVDPHACIVSLCYAFFSDKLANALFRFHVAHIFTVTTVDRITCALAQLCVKYCLWLPSEIIPLQSETKFHVQYVGYQTLRGWRDDDVSEVCWTETMNVC
jgi:hypothetical protein